MSQVRPHPGIQDDYMDAFWRGWEALQIVVGDDGPYPEDLTTARVALDAMDLLRREISKGLRPWETHNQEETAP